MNGNRTSRSFEYARYRHGHTINGDGGASNRQVMAIGSGEHDLSQPEWDIARWPGTGSLSEEGCFHDMWAYSTPNGFPSGIDMKTGTKFKPARTTFHAKDEPRREHRFDELWMIHHGLDSWPECPIDEVKRGLRVDNALRYKNLACETTAQALAVPEHVKKEAIQRVMTIDCRGFSAHYGGVYGAVVGFAMEVLFDSPEEAKASNYWPAVESIMEPLGVHPGDLVDYVFRKYDSMEGGE